MTNDQKKSENTLRMANAIMMELGGHAQEESQTALSIAIISMIVACYGPEEYQKALYGFYTHCRAQLENPRTRGVDQFLH